MSDQEESTAPSGETENKGSEPSWWLDDNTPGQGDRPAWLPEKFKRVSDLSKSYNELETKLKQPVVDKYDFGEYDKVFNVEHPALKELSDYAKENRVPQEVFSKTLESFTKYAQDFAIDIDAEKAKLGDDADKRLERLNNWASSNLSKESAQALMDSMVTAQSVLAIEEIRQKMLGSTSKIPNGTDNDSATPSYTVEEVQAEISDNYDKYKSDSSYREQMKAKLSSAAKSSKFVDKRSG